MVRLELTCDQLLFLRLIRLRRYISMLYKAEERRFELLVPNYGTSVQQTDAINRSAILPIFCRVDTIRTCGHVVPNHVLYLLSYYPKFCRISKNRTQPSRSKFLRTTDILRFFCEPTEVRTQDPILKRDVLYLLSYRFNCSKKSYRFNMLVQEVGLEPTRLNQTKDFKSFASTYSAIPASMPC